MWENNMLYNNLLRNFKRHCRRAGITTDNRLMIHGLRKSFATNLSNSGQVPAHTLQKLMGHSDIKTTMEYYIQSGDANEERAVAALDKMMGVVG